MVRVCGRRYGVRAVRVFLVRVFLVRVFLGTAVVCSVVDGFRGTALGSVRFCVL